jgi:site-specific recombinase XerD
MKHKQNQTIEQLIQDCSSYLEQRPFSKNTVRQYKFMWNKGIVPFMENKSILHYNSSIGDEFLQNYLTEFTVTAYQRNFIRSIYILNEFQENGCIKKYRFYPVTRELTGKIGLIMEKFILRLESKRIDSHTISNYRISLYRFHIFLKEHNILDVGNINEEHILLFFTTLKLNKVAAICSIRQFLKFLFEEKMVQFDYSSILKHHKLGKKEKLPSVYTSAEVLQIESSINRESSEGKRDYAMILLATRLGLRASDIAYLTFSNIDWEKNTIILSQFKTGKLIELPLLAIVGEAIIDYLKYGRKKSDSQNIFLYARPPYTAITNASVSSAISRVIKTSGVDISTRKHSSHAMRHSLASRFLEKQVSIPVISEALGHKSVGSTMDYLRIDMESLRQCSLNVPCLSNLFYEQKGGFLYE